MFAIYMHLCICVYGEMCTLNVENVFAAERYITIIFFLYSFQFKHEWIQRERERE